MRFGARDGITRLLAASSAGPLRVVRAEAGPVCDAVVVQTRGGLCVGDRWLLDVEVTDGARVRLRAAGATILHSGPAGCRTRLRVSGGSRLSYRARGVIAMPGATGVGVTVVDAGPGCRVAVSEIVAPFTGRVLRSRLVVRRHGRAVHEEWTELRDRGPTQLGEATVLGSAVHVGRGCTWPRMQVHDGVLAASGAPVPGVTVARALGSSVQAVDALIGPLVEAIHCDRGQQRTPRLGPAHNASPARFAP